MPTNLQAIVLASGISDRFKTNKTKFIEKICGKEMVMYPLQLLKNLKIPITLVVGYQHDRIEKVLNGYKKIDLNIVLEDQPLGSGHAAMLTQSFWKQDNILIMGADIPLLTEDVIIKLYAKHIKTDSDISFITAHGIDIENKNYCRIIINDNKIHVLKGTEPNHDQENQCCISGGVYIIKKSFLEKNINLLTKSSISNEYYLPELVQIASNNNCKIVTSPVSIDVIRCVDSLSDLWAIEHIKRSQIIRNLMDNGVRVANALNVIIDESVVVEPGVFIGSGANLLGSTIVKSDTTIGAYSCIENSLVKDCCNIQSHVVINNSTIPEHTTIKPFTIINNQNDLIVKSKQAEGYNKFELEDSDSSEEAMKIFTGAIKTKSLDKNHNI